MPESPSPRLFFVITKAFGELFNAMYMTMGCGFDTVFAMPDSMYTLNHAVLPGRCYRFDTLADLIPSIDAEQPHIVCLFSGYLYAKDNLGDFDQLDLLLAHLRERGIEAITSDPFLGLAGRLPRINPANPIEQLLSLPMKLVGEAAIGPEFSYLMRGTYSLARIPHVYIVDPEESGETPRLAFFNPYLRFYQAELGDRAKGDIDGQRLAPDRPWWLFILSGSDYRVEDSAVLAQRIRDTLAQGRQPVLIAPKHGLQSLAADPSLAGCVFVERCDYVCYMALLLGAEYVFYWNIFSASILARLLTSGSVFFFGRGHLAGANDLILEKGLSSYYAGVRLPWLEPGAPLDSSQLAGLAAAHEADVFRPMLQTVRHLPHPRTMLQPLIPHA